MEQTKNNILEISEGCTGCGVCSTVCPKKCIEIKENKYGFYEPILDETLCIDCGQCKKVCYKFLSENEEGVSIYDSKGYLAYNKDEKTRKLSSSGGIGAAISELAIKNNYNVIGVDYDFERDRAKHIIINEISDIGKITGSKYIPSFTEEAFKNLDKSKNYVVFGTPCQIYGLRKYAKIKNFKNLILVDFFCHGAPSFKIWDKYIEYIKKQNNISEITHINFRDKTHGWHEFSINVQSKENSWLNRADKDVFFDFFLRNLCLPISCYTCKLRFNKIYSDIRIGDFWGPKCQNDNLGTSIVLSNTEIGENLLKELKNIHMENVTFNDIKESQYVEKLNIPKKRELVLEALKSDISIIKMYNKYVRFDKIKEKIKWKIKKIIKI